MLDIDPGNLRVKFRMELNAPGAISDPKRLVVIQLTGCQENRPGRQLDYRLRMAGMGLDLLRQPVKERI